MNTFSLPKTLKTCAVVVATVGAVSASSVAAQSTDAEMFADAFGAETAGVRFMGPQFFADAFGAENTTRVFVSAAQSEQMFKGAFGVELSEDRHAAAEQRKAIRNTYLTDLNAPEWVYIQQAGLVPAYGG